MTWGKFVIRDAAEQNEIEEKQIENNAFVKNKNYNRIENVENQKKLAKVQNKFKQR